MSNRRFALLGIGVALVATAVILPSCTPAGPPSTNVVTDTIFDTEYLRYTFYRVDTMVRHGITDLRVYIDDANPYNNTNSLSCLATVFPTQPESFPPYNGDRFAGCFDSKLADTDYFSSSQGIIEFISPLSSNYTIGVSYVDGPDTVGGYWWQSPQVGESLLVLKLVKPQRMDTVSLTWCLGTRNIYSLGVKNVALDSVRLVRWLSNEIPREVDENGRRFLYLVGLDPDDDGIVVWPQFDSSGGYLICGKTFLAESLTVKDSIYGPDGSNSSPKYRFVVKYTVADTDGAPR